MKKWLFLFAVAALLIAGGYAYVQGDLAKNLPESAAGRTDPVAPQTTEPQAIAVSVAVVAPAQFVETVMVTGSLVPREQIYIAAEIEGQRIVELHADEGDYVRKGDLLATLEREALEAQRDQNTASIARAEASIARARSSIAEAEARLEEAEADLKRAKPLRSSGHLSESAFDTRQALARTARAQLASAQHGLVQAEAEKNQSEAQGRELDWRLSKTEVRAPADGLISRRTARIGGLVSGAKDPLFLLISKAEIELDAEVPEARLARVEVGQTAHVTPPGGQTVSGAVRLISPEVDKTSRLGHVRIFLGQNPNLRIGAFARGTIETRRTSGLAVPQSAVLYQASENGQRALVQRVRENRVETVEVEIGAITTDLLEITSGLAEGDIIVAKAGTFLRNGDSVTPITPSPEVSEAGR